MTQHTTATIANLARIIGTDERGFFVSTLKLTIKDVAMLFEYREELREHAAQEREYARDNKVCPGDMSNLTHEHQARVYMNDARTVTAILRAIIMHGTVKLPSDLMDSLYSF